jgi:hypothetical protein
MRRIGFVEIGLDTRKAEREQVQECPDCLERERRLRLDIFGREAAYAGGHRQQPLESRESKVLFNVLLRLRGKLLQELFAIAPFFIIRSCLRTDATVRRTATGAYFRFQRPIVSEYLSRAFSEQTRYA